MGPSTRSPWARPRPKATGQSSSAGPWARDSGPWDWGARAWDWGAWALPSRPLQLCAHGPVLLPLVLGLLLAGLLMVKCGAQQVLGMALEFEAQEREMLRQPGTDSPYPSPRRGQAASGRTAPLHGTSRQRAVERGKGARREASSRAAGGPQHGTGSEGSAEKGRSVKGSKGRGGKGRRKRAGSISSLSVPYSHEAQSKQHSSLAAAPTPAPTPAPAPAPAPAPDTQGSKAPLGEHSFDLEQYLRFPYDDGSCGPPDGWARTYQAMHRRMRAGETERKYISFAWPPGGLGDQLVGVVSTFLTGLLLNRSIIIGEPRLEAAFEPAEVNWTYSRGDVVWSPFRHCQYDACREANATISEEEGKNYALLVNVKSKPPPDEFRSNVKFPTDIFEFFRNLSNYQNLKLQVNGGIITRIFGSNTPEEAALARLGLNITNTFPCVLRYLLRPKQAVMELATPLVAKLPGPPAHRLCLHLRSQDRMDEKCDKEKRELFQWTQKHMLGCALNVSNFFLPRESYWLLVADSMFLKKRVKQWAQDHPNVQLFESDIKPAHVQDGGEVTSAAEWVLFSTCKFYVIPQSAFSKTSLAFNMWSPVAFILPRMDEERMSRIRPAYEGMCTLDKPSGAAEFRELTGL